MERNAEYCSGVRRPVLVVSRRVNMVVSIAFVNSVGLPEVWRDCHCGGVVLG